MVTGTPESAADVFLYLTTVGRVSCLPRTIEIWFVEHAGCLYVVAERREQAQWVRNIQHNPAVRFRVGQREDASPRDQGWRPGAARIVREPELVAAVASRMDDKYGWSDGLIVEIRPAS